MKKRSFLLASIIIIMLVSSCANNQTDSLLTPTITSTQRETAPTATSMVTSTSAPIATPTASTINIAIPTIETNGDEEAIEFLFNTNNYCDFPCWWGIIPGKTKWVDAEDFLSPLAERILHRDHYSFLESGFVQHVINFNAPLLYEPDGLGSIAVVENKEGIVHWISVITNLNGMGLDIVHFMEKYGPPSEVYIYSTGSISIYMGDEGDFIIALFYRNLGILVAYYGKTDRVAMEDAFIEICSSRMIQDYAYLKLWDPSKMINFETLANPGLSAAGELVFQPVNEVSNLTPTSLHNQFIELNNQDFCFEIENPGYSN